MRLCDRFRTTGTSMASGTVILKSGYKERRVLDACVTAGEVCPEGREHTVPNVCRKIPDPVAHRTRNTKFNLRRTVLSECADRKLSWSFCGINYSILYRKHQGF